jgi:hypothetical protein
MARNVKESRSGSDNSPFWIYTISFVVQEEMELRWPEGNQALWLKPGKCSARSAPRLQLQDRQVSGMIARCSVSSTAIGKVCIRYFDNHDEGLLQVLVTADALVALADGHIQPSEREELGAFIDRQGFLPTSWRQAGVHGGGRNCAAASKSATPRT